ncbi:MAG: hypothetical protein U9Q67_04800, partial [Patescibacteria group bacterium]|nr:hypothetical protein [Patescibacteria group bacterium]
PLWSGQCQKKYSFLHRPSETYLDAEYSGLHKMPAEYTQVAEILNQEQDDFKIMSIPYSVIESPGWVKYPMWNVIGADPTIQLFEKPVIQMNSYGGTIGGSGAFGTWNFGEYWNSQTETESLWLVRFASVLNVKYFLYHKDIETKFVDQTIDKIRYYEELGLISNVFEGQYVNLYKIDNYYLVPHIYVPSSNELTSLDLEKLPDLLGSPEFESDSALYFLGQNIEKREVFERFSSLVYAFQSIEYEQVNPTNYHIKIYGASGSFPLVFAETYHDGWQLFLAGKTDALDETKHLKVNGYANAWIIDVSELCSGSDLCSRNDEGTYDIVLSLEFVPQKLYYSGLAVSLSVMIAALLYLIYNYRIANASKNTSKIS